MHAACAAHVCWCALTAQAALRNGVQARLSCEPAPPCMCCAAACVAIGSVLRACSMCELCIRQCSRARSCTRTHACTCACTPGLRCSHRCCLDTRLIMCVGARCAAHTALDAVVHRALALQARTRAHVLCCLVCDWMCVACLQHNMPVRLCEAASAHPHACVVCVCVLHVDECARVCVLCACSRLPCLCLRVCGWQMRLATHRPPCPPATSTHPHASKCAARGSAA